MTGDPVVPIVCGVDAGYVTPLLGLMNSVCRAHDDAVRELLLIVLHDDLRAESQEQILREGRRLHLAIEFRTVASATVRWSVSGWVSPAVYLRLSTAAALPDFRRALYLDTDTLVLHDLRPLLSADLGGAALGAVRDPQNPVLDAGIALPGWVDMGLPADREYFNSGVLLLDLDACRDSRLFEHARAFLDRHETMFWDQDALNWAADDRWRRLERRWNTFALSPLVDRGGFVHYAEHIVPLTRLIDDERSAAVLHFAGPDKPWTPRYPGGRLLNLYRTYLPDPFAERSETHV